MLFAVLASRRERLPVEHLRVMSLEAASLRDRACQGAPATRAKRGKYDPQISLLKVCEPLFQRGVRCHPQPLLSHQSGEHSGDIPSAVCQLPGHTVLGRGKAPFKVAWVAVPLPAASSLRLQTQLVFYSLSACCLHMEMLNETFCRRSQSTQLPRGQEHPSDQSARDGAAGTKRGLHENKAGREEKSSCKHSTRLTQRNLPPGTSCLPC